ncbi:MAG: type I restriction enzyme HsdR N-terminal domain-containing protein [Planctomycetota bacterium]|nr:type I restriction enzyme HsdR N-terminal domain-containing protein [Planctomycetota bacterium]
MAKVPKKVVDRLGSGLRRFQPILSSAKARDVNEADTVTIVTDVLAELLGYDKYSEITSELQIRGTYCDLAIRIENKIKFIVEVKAIGLDLKDTHTKQAVDYGANQGCEWVALTNGVNWKVFHIAFTRPIKQQLVFELDLLTLNPRLAESAEALYPITREGLLKAALSDYHSQRQAMNRYSLSALLLGDSILKVLRRELKRLAPGIKIQTDDIKSVLMHEVLKREVVDGEQATEAMKKVRRANRKQLRTKRKG